MRLTSAGFHIGEIFRISVVVEPSTALFAFAFIPPFVLLSSSTGILLERLILVPLIVLSVLAHEFAHARVATALKIPIRRIVLTWFGGFAELWFKPRSRTEQAMIALAGPLANLAIAAVAFSALWLFAGDQSGWYVLNPLLGWSAPSSVNILGAVAALNLSFFLFNLLPGLPLDGGHVLKAALATKMGGGRAEWFAAWAGVLIGGGVVLYAIWIEELWLLVIGIFVLFSAWLIKHRLRYD